MIIGLTGSLSAGKGLVSDFLKQKGFVYLSLSNELREILKENKITLTRENLQNFGNKLREEKGSGVLAKIVVEKIKNQKYVNAIVDGIRNPAEVIILRQLKNFFLISVDAPQEIRFKRMVSRNRESDPVTWEDFLKVDARDKGLGESETGQGVGKCMELADFTLINDSSLEKVQEKVENLYKEIKGKLPRISWDEYFMGVALLSSKRSKDPSTQVGACIVDKNKKIVGTGYNGAPRGIPDNEFPWQREGDYLETKYAYVCHAELNAILNSTKESLEGCTLYCTLFPCNECAKAIIQSGIKKVFFLSNKYKDDPSCIASKKMLFRVGIELEELSPETDFISLDFSEAKK